MAQEQQRKVRREDEEPPAPPAPLPGGAAAQARQQDVDSLLADIDTVLETNAESFVRGFVQKGGQ